MPPLLMLQLLVIVHTVPSDEPQGRTHTFVKLQASERAETSSGLTANAILPTYATLYPGLPARQPPTPSAFFCPPLVCCCSCCRWCATPPPLMLCLLTYLCHVASLKQGRDVLWPRLKCNIANICNIVPRCPSRTIATASTTKCRPAALVRNRRLLLLLLAAAL